MLIGLIVFAAALGSHADRLALALLGGVILVVTALYIREGFALVFCAATAALMLAGAWYLPRLAADLLLRVIGLASMIYVPYDIVSDTILRAGLRSDARMLAEEIGGATLLWGGLWLIVSLAVIGFSLRIMARDASNLM